MAFSNTVAMGLYLRVLQKQLRVNMRAANGGEAYEREPLMPQADVERAHPLQVL